MPDQNIQIVSSLTTSCDGAGDSSGHPKVYIKLDEQTHQGTCPYCSRIFKLDPNAKVSAGH